MTSDLEGALARVRIGAIQHPAVRVAFADGAGFLQHEDRERALRARYLVEMAGKLKPHVCIKLANARSKVKRSEPALPRCSAKRGARHALGVLSDCIQAALERVIEACP